MKITTLILTNTGKVIRYENEGRPLSLFELANRTRTEHGLDLFNRKTVLFVHDLTEEDLQPTI